MPTKKKDEPSALEQVERFVLKAVDRTDPVYVGVDPGATGAIAFLCGPLYLVVDIPTFSVARKRVVKVRKRTPGGPKTKTVDGKTTVFDNANTVRLFRALKPLKSRLYVALEIAQPMVKGKKGNNPRTAYLVGIGYGMWPLFLLSKGYSLEETQPNAWKKDMGLLRKDKNASRKVAQAAFPAAPLSRTDDHNRAEALLLAKWLMQRRKAADP